MPKIIFPFEPGAKVHIDGDKSITAIVTAVIWRNGYVQGECSWFAQAVLQSAWIDVDRLSEVK